jgi:hypothetical protein
VGGTGKNLSGKDATLLYLPAAVMCSSRFQTQSMACRSANIAVFLSGLQDSGGRMQEALVLSDFIFILGEKKELEWSR